MNKEENDIIEEVKIIKATGLKENYYHGEIKSVQIENRRENEEDAFFLITIETYGLLTSFPLAYCVSRQEVFHKLKENLTRLGFKLSTLDDLRAIKDELAGMKVIVRRDHDSWYFVKRDKHSRKTPVHAAPMGNGSDPGSFQHKGICRSGETCAYRKEHPDFLPELCIASAGPEASYCHVACEFYNVYLGMPSPRWMDLISENFFFSATPRCWEVFQDDDNMPPILRRVNPLCNLQGVLLSHIAHENIPYTFEQDDGMTSPRQYSPLRLAISPVDERKAEVPFVCLDVETPDVQKERKIALACIFRARPLRQNG